MAISLRDRCENYLTMSVTYCGEVLDPFDGADTTHLRRKWRCDLNSDGRTMSVDFYTGADAGKPTVSDVMDCLLSDADTVEQSDGFEEWARDLGFDTDSRRAEQTYQAATAQTYRLRRLLGAYYEKWLYETERDQ